MPDTVTALDPISFEILSSRLSAINDEAATTMRLVSGSPGANEAYDMNVGLMGANGACFAIGRYNTNPPHPLGATGQGVKEGDHRRPGIPPGGNFLSTAPHRR